MTCLSSTRIADLQAKIARYTAMLDAAVTSYELAISNGVESYRFDAGGGEASQMAKSINSEQLLNDIIRLEAKIDSYNRALNGLGVITIKLRRYSNDFICGASS